MTRLWLNIPPRRGSSGLFLGLALLLAQVTPALAQNAPETAVVPAPTEAVPEPTPLNAMREKLAQLQAQGKIDANLFVQAEVNVATGRLQVQNLQLELEGARRELEQKINTVRTLETQFEDIKKRPLDPNASVNLEIQLSALEDVLGLQREQYAQLQERRVQLDERLRQTEAQLAQDAEWLKNLRPLYLNVQERSLEALAQRERSKYEETAAKLRKKWVELPPDPEARKNRWRSLLEAQILDAEERAQAAQHELRLNQAEGELKRLRGLLDAHLQVPLEADASQRAGELLNDLEHLQALLEQKQAVFSRHLEVLQQRTQVGRDAAKLSAEDKKFAADEQKLLEELVLMRNEHLDWAQRLQEQLGPLREELAAAHAEDSLRMLLKRRHLAATPGGWPELLRQLGAVPTQLQQHLASLFNIARQDLQRVGGAGWSVAVFFSLLLLGGLAWVHQRLRRHLRCIEERERDLPRQDSFLRNSVSLMLDLIDRNLVGLGLAAALLVLVWVIRPAQSTALLLLSLSLLWLMVRLPMALAWLLLAAPGVSETYANPKLYRQLRWMLVLAGVLTSVTLLLHLLPFPESVREVNDTLFMLFLSATALPALHIRALALRQIEPELQAKRWLPTLRLISLLLPLAILAVGVLGVVGYINLGWLVAEQLSWFLLVLTGWLVSRSLLFDLTAYAKNVALTRSRNYGLLWTQDLIPLLSKLSRVGLLVGAVLLLLHINGWSGAAVIHDTLNYPLLEVGQSVVRLSGLLLSALALYSVFWFGTWTRQITYRWIYSNITDLGVRHSLSVFTQYAVVIVGGLITLRLLGLDLTTFTVFAGALGVGLGFGLQNIANNFVSGLLLLAERPLRTGDLVNIGGNYEGEVTRMGVRSLTVKTWDNQEVIVPNSQLISEAFTNWTRTDTVLRTILMIGVSYDADLEQTQRILLGALQQHPAVLQDREPMVLLTDFADSSVMFRLQYHANLREHSLLRVKSEILLDIWRRFKAAGIEIPYPQRDIHIKAYPSQGDATAMPMG